MEILEAIIVTVASVIVAHQLVIKPLQESSKQESLQILDQIPYADGIVFLDKQTIQDELKVSGK